MSNLNSDSTGDNQAACSEASHNSTIVGTAPASTICPGDTVLPPARELQLWIRKYFADNNLPESDLYMTVISVQEGRPDKNGAWLIVDAVFPGLWPGHSKPFGFKFKARPHTPWPIARQAQAA